MTTTKTNDTHISNETIANTTTTDVQSFLNSYKTNTSMRERKKNKYLMFIFLQIVILNVVDQFANQKEQYLIPYDIYIKN